MKIKIKGLKIDEEGYINTNLAVGHKYHYKLNENGKDYTLTDYLPGKRIHINDRHFSLHSILYLKKTYKHLNQ